MGTSYDEAMSIVEAEGRMLSDTFQAATETVPLSKALNRISKDTYRCSESTPKWDTSAMDGYALNSEATLKASEQNPVMFCVKTTIAAGDEPVPMSGEPVEEGIYPCAEIMTGARFPTCSSGKGFDCCVRIEDTGCTVPAERRFGREYIRVFKPARSNQHKRLAGEDFRERDVVVEEGSVVRPHHIMALASVGVEMLTVLRKPRVALFSTGSELLPRASRTADVNGPYISATLEDLGCDVDFLGAIEDNNTVAAQKISHRLSERKECDVVISTGGVSAGKFDCVRGAIERLNACILFHGVAMRPGHPVLFATIPPPESSLLSNGHTLASPSTKTAFFGLPGNPVAGAACLRFLVVPFLRALLSRPSECAVPATFRSNECHTASFPSDKDVFRPAKILSNAGHRNLEVAIISDHSPGKVKPFLGANCWAHIPPGQAELGDGDAVSLCPMTDRGLLAVEVGDSPIRRADSHVSYPRMPN